MNTDSDMGIYSIPAIGDRPKVIKDDNIKAIYLRGIPNVLITTEEERLEPDVKQYYDNQSGYNILNVSNSIAECFAISSRSKTAQDELDSLLY